MNNLLSINNLKKNYNTTNGEIEAIKDISFNVKEGEFIAIVGCSGCGMELKVFLSIVGFIIIALMGFYIAFRSYQLESR